VAVVALGSAPRRGSDGATGPDLDGRAGERSGERAERYCRVSGAFSELHHISVKRSTNESSSSKRAGDVPHM